MLEREEMEWRSEANEVPETCILSNDQQGATPLFVSLKVYDPTFHLIYIIGKPFRKEFKLSSKWNIVHFINYCPN